MKIKRKIFKEITLRLLIVSVVSVLAKILYPISIDYISKNFSWIALILLFSSIIMIVLEYFFLGFYLMIKKYLLNESIDENNKLISIILIIVGIGTYTVMAIEGIKLIGFPYMFLTLIGLESIRFIFNELIEDDKNLDGKLE